jgi:hypothetical protein
MSKTLDAFVTITWHDARREPQCPPNPAYPDGIDILAPRHGEPGFKVEMAGRAIILASAHMTLNERKDDDEEAQTSKAIFGVGG